MKEEIYNEKELKSLEDEIRAMGIPYSSGEPDDRYFVNFRVRLLERIDAKEQKKSILQAIWAWLTVSPLRSLSLATGLAGVIIAALLIRPNSEPKLAKVQLVPKTIENSIVLIPKETQPDLAAASKPRVSA